MCENWLFGLVLIRLRIERINLHIVRNVSECSPNFGTTYCKSIYVQHMMSSYLGQVTGIYLGVKPMVLPAS